MDSPDAEFSMKNHISLTGLQNTGKEFEKFQNNKSLSRTRVMDYCQENPVNSKLEASGFSGFGPFFEV